MGRFFNEANMLKQYVPMLSWMKLYDRETFSSDLIAALVVTIMLIPQSLAYALLAGLPAQVGLYASILPLIAYMIFGTSRALAVGPVAVASLMTAAAVGQLAAKGSPEYLGAAIALAFISGLMLLAMGFLRLGFLANFLSHPVISGFITASGIIIAASQVKHILGVKSSGDNLIEILHTLWESIGSINFATLLIGIPALIFLFWVRKGFKPFLEKTFKLSSKNAALLAKTGPVIAVIVFTSLAAIFALDQTAGVAIVGDVPRGLPTPTLPPFNLEMWKLIAIPALLISVVGYVETISVAQTLAAKRRQRVDPDQELIALGASNIASSISGGFPVTGGFSRSVVNFDAGAQTPLAGAMTAIGIALVALFLTPLIYFLPNAVLGATIIVAVLSLIDIQAIKHTWSYSKYDFAAMIATIIVTLLRGVEMGIIVGVSLSIFLHLMRTARPHVAIVGQVPGTEHFRNVKRHAVVTTPEIVTLRVDESLYFPNARFLEDTVNAQVASNSELKHVVLQCTAINAIDASALESLEAINLRLKDAGILLHLTEVKGPVMDGLKRSHLLHDLTGEVFLTQYQAIQKLAPESLKDA